MMDQNGAGDATNQDGDEGNEVTHKNGGEEASPERRAEYNREMSPWTPENSYRHHLINDIWRIHDERSDNKVGCCKGQRLIFA